METIEIKPDVKKFKRKRNQIMTRSRALAAKKGQENAERDVIDLTYSSPIVNFRQDFETSEQGLVSAAVQVESGGQSVDNVTEEEDFENLEEVQQPLPVLLTGQLVERDEKRKKCRKLKSGYGICPYCSPRSPVLIPGASVVVKRSPCGQHCVKCTFWSLNKRQVKMHVESVHQAAKKAENPPRKMRKVHCCTQCCRVFSTAPQYRRHTQTRLHLNMSRSARNTALQLKEKFNLPLIVEQNDVEDSEKLLEEAQKRLGAAVPREKMVLYNTEVFQELPGSNVDSTVPATEIVGSEAERIVYETLAKMTPNSREKMLSIVSTSTTQQYGVGKYTEELGYYGSSVNSTVPTMADFEYLDTQFQQQAIEHCATSADPLDTPDWQQIYQYL